MPAVRPRLGRNVVALAAVSFLTDASSEMIYPLLPLFLTGVLGAGATALGAIEGAAESTAAFLKLGSGWWSDRLRRRKPLVVLGYALATALRPLVGLARAPAQVLAIRLGDRVGKGIRTSPRDALIADSIPPEVRGRAFGFQRAGDHAGAVVGPLVAFALLSWTGMPLREVFLWSAVPGVLSVLLLVLAVRETPRAPVDRSSAPPAAAADLRAPLPRRFWAVLAVVLLFALGNSSDAFLLLRAAQLGVAAPLIPVLWALLHAVKALVSTPGGALSDRLGRKPLLVAGWGLYALVYLGLGAARAEWQVWALFAAYGVHFGLTEGVEKALVADLVPAARRGTAFGWYNLTLGLGALPAALLFGFVWDRAGAPAAFGLGAALALAAAAGIAAVAPRRVVPVRPL
ncbi:MAG TPA: MFS transporter [Thermoanaerobaculia bacterium]